MSSLGCAWCMAVWLVAGGAPVRGQGLAEPPPAALRRTPLTDIVGIVLHTHFQQPYATTLVVLRGQTADGRDELRDLLSVLLAEYVRGQLVVQFDGAPPGPRYRRPWSYVLLLAEGYEALRTVYGQLTLARYDFAGYYLLVLTGADTSLALVDRIFNDLWQRQIVNVLVVFRARPPGVVQLWTYYPYSPGMCRIPKPSLVLTWPNDTLLYGVDFFPRKNAHFHGCPLHVGTFETRPFTILTGSPLGASPGLSGFEGDLLRSLAGKLNFGVKLRIPPHAQQWGRAAYENSTGMMRMLYDEEVDLGIGCLGVSFERSSMLKPGKVHFTSELVVVVPPGRSYTPLEKLTQPFRGALWGALLTYTALGLLAIGVAHRWPPARRYLVGRGVHGPGLNLLRLLFGSPVPRPPAATFPRTLLLLWIQFCFVVQILYQGSMFKFLQRASHHPPMGTLDEIDRAGVRYHITESARRFFEPFPARLAHLQYFPPGPDSIGARLRWMGEHAESDPDVTMCTRDHVAYYNLMHRHRRRGGVGGGQRRLWIAREPMALYTVTVLYPKKSMLTSSFDEQIERIESSGLLKYWVSQYGDYHFFESRSPTADQAPERRPISFGQVRGAFELLLVLLAVSSAILFGEIYWVQRRDRNPLSPPAGLRRLWFRNAPHLSGGGRVNAAVEFLGDPTRETGDFLPPKSSANFASTARAREAGSDRGGGPKFNYFLN